MCAMYPGISMDTSLLIKSIVNTLEVTTIIIMQTSQGSSYWLPSNNQFVQTVAVWIRENCMPEAERFFFFNLGVCAKLLSLG